MSKKVTRSEKVEFKGFCRFTLNKEHKAAVSRLADSGAPLEAMLESLTQNDYKISFSWNDAESVWVVTAYGHRPPNPNLGYCLSFMNVSLYRALCALYLVISDVYRYGVWDGINGYDNGMEW